MQSQQIALAHSPKATPKVAKEASVAAGGLNVGKKSFGNTNAP
jgi:hypothetical protein